MPGPLRGPFATQGRSHRPVFSLSPAQRSVEKHHHRNPPHQPWVMELGAALGIKVEPALEALKVAVHI